MRTASVMLRTPSCDREDKSPAAPRVERDILISPTTPTIRPFDIRSSIAWYTKIESVTDRVFSGKALPRDGIADDGHADRVGVSVKAKSRPAMRGIPSC